MPKPGHKRPQKPPSSSDSDSGPDDRKPPSPKKSNIRGGATAGASAKAPGALPGDEPSWSIGKMKFVKVREFKGTTYIDIREYYTDNKTMDIKPGKKGISLSCEQYQKLKEIMPDIDAALP